jgi:hypothetical protein
MTRDPFSRFPFRKTLPFFLLILLLISIFPAGAENNTISFTIAPPPVGYPQFTPAELITQAGGNLLFLSLDVMEEKVYLFGGLYFYNYQYTPFDRVSLSGSVGGSLLAGNKYSLLVGRLPLGANFIVEAVRLKTLALYLFGGVGGDVGISTMTVTIPQWVIGTSTFIDDDTSVTTYSASGLISGGLQLNITAGPLIISPFGVVSYAVGAFQTSQTSTMSYEYPSTSGTTAEPAGTVIGFDVLYVPRHIALSSQLRLTERYNLLSVALKWMVKNRENLASQGP